MNHSEINCIVQARMGSSRLYGKVMAKADDEYIVFDYLINQLKHSKLIQKIIIATTTNKEDDLIVEFAKKNQIEFFRGNESDVLDRYYQCAKNFSSNNILRITSDNPLTDPTVIDDLIINYQKISCDYASTSLIRTYPFRIEAEIFSFSSVKRLIVFNIFFDSSLITGKTFTISAAWPECNKFNGLFESILL